MTIVTALVIILNFTKSVLNMKLAADCENGSKKMIDSGNKKENKGKLIFSCFGRFLQSILKHYRVISLIGYYQIFWHLVVLILL